MARLEVESLAVRIGAAQVLRGVSFVVEAGRTLGVVGESGCGKSMTGLALMGMLPPVAEIVGGRIQFEGKDLTTLTAREWRRIRGQEISMVMQDPFTSLNPMMRVGDQIAEVWRLHEGLSRAEAGRRAVAMLEKVGVPTPEETARKYPHQMSGGQRQRVVIAIAFAARPKLLIADEPTTALDVTLQAQILQLLRDLQREEGTSVILISHDIGVIGALADEIAVYYAGRVVEYGTGPQVLQSPAHPYTQALLDAVPRVGQDRLHAISGQPPDMAALSSACAFAPRCVHRFDRCEREPGLMAVGPGHTSACWRAETAPVTSPGRTATP